MFVMRKLLFFLVFVIVSGLLEAQQSDTGSMHRSFKTAGGNTWGMYGQLSGSFSPSGDKYLGWLGAKLGTVYNNWLRFGVAGYGLFNEDLTWLDVHGRQYRMEAATGGLYIEPHFDLTRRLSFGISLYMGNGIAQLRYDKEYRAEMLWTEEVVDQVSFTVFEPGVNVEYRLTPRWAVAAGATYRNTSPLRLWSVGDKVLQGFSTEVSLKFGLF